MQGIEDLLLFAPATPMDRDHFVEPADFYLIGVALDGDILISILHGHGVVVVIKTHQQQLIESEALPGDPNRFVSRKSG